MTLQGVSPNTTTNATSATSGNNSATQSPMGSLDTTFLNLLISEMKSQDPTAPMDATQMVGQMVSLNQLDQLIAIHQLLQAGGTTTQNAPNTATQGGN